MSHVLPNGLEKPIAFASRTLSDSEQNYSQIDKEALALIFGVHKFHTYLYGRKFMLVTDHKPLMSILGPKEVSSVAAARLQRWSLLLSAYNYDIEFRPTEAHGNADALSRQSPQTALGGTSLQHSPDRGVASNQQNNPYSNTARSSSQQGPHVHQKRMA